MASKQTSGAAALRYATALVDSAEASKKIDAVEKDLNDLEAMISDSKDLQNLIHSPLISQSDKIKAIQAIAQAAKFQNITSNFLALLAQNSRLNIVMAIVKAVRKEISSRRGEVSANIQSAFKLSKEQEKALQESLAKAVGQAVAIQVEVKEDLIGGMVVTVGSQMFDASVKRKLERLKIAMKSNANNNAANSKVANEN
ncbi:MAG: F0F1 ATP synthase subunit delta [Alphaproteobacteria bacterium]|nr:F0F1 ATP synthase subunit delta [Alphaproteobacteria bacterium]